MNVNQFSQINPFIGKYINQNNTRHLSWMQQFGGRLHSEIVDQLGASVPSLLSSAIAQYDAAEQHEDDCYLIITKSEKTELIAQIDAERDTKYIGLKSMADALSRIGTAEQKQWAAQLLDLVAHYKVDISERYDDETTKMSQLLQVLKSPEWTARVAGLGLTATVDELDALNQQMKTLIQQRNDELANVTPQAMADARKAADEAYSLVVTIINALAVTDWADGSSHYDQAITRINQDQDYYLKNVFAQQKPGGSGSQSGQSNQSNQSTQNQNANENQNQGGNENQNQNENENPGGNENQNENPGTGGDNPGTGDNGGDNPNYDPTGQNGGTDGME